MRRSRFKFYKKSEWIAIVSLIALCLAGLILPHFIGRNVESSNNIKADSLTFETLTTDSNRQTKHHKAKKRRVETFVFDPNTADSITLLRLGFAPFQVRGILRYRAAGGVIHDKEDFAQLYNLTKGDYDRLAPYVRIADEFRLASEFVKRNNKSKSIDETDENSTTTTYIPKISRSEFVSVNYADTAELQRIPGIGQYYARQILHYRKSLGGYADESQLLEIEGFPEEALDYIVIEGGVKRLNLNKSTLLQLRSHPYINFYQAREIIEMHRKNGRLNSLDDLRFSKFFTPTDIKRLAPYVEF